MMSMPALEEMSWSGRRSLRWSSEPWSCWCRATIAVFMHHQHDEHACDGGDELVVQEVAAVVKQALVVLVQGDHRRVCAPPA